MIRRLLPLSLFTVAALILGAITQPTSAGGKDKKKPAPEIPPRQGKSETIHLFNGKNLDGWEGYEDLWSVKDGVIVGKNTSPIKYSTYLLTKRQFSDFRLVFAFKLVKAKNDMHSGVSLWGHRFPEVPGVKDPKAERTEYTYQGQLVMFPTGYGLYDLYRRNGLPVDTAPARKAGKQRDWNDMEILAQGNRIRYALNGKLVLDWRDPQPDLVGEGPIGLQLHSNDGPQELHWKGLVLTTFPEDKMTTLK